MTDRQSRRRFLVQAVRDHPAVKKMLSVARVSSMEENILTDLMVHRTDLQTRAIAQCVLPTDSKRPNPFVNSTALESIVRKRLPELEFKIAKHSARMELPEDEPRPSFTCDWDTGTGASTYFATHMWPFLVSESPSKAYGDVDGADGVADLMEKAAKLADRSDDPFLLSIAAAKTKRGRCKAATRWRKHGKDKKRWGRLLDEARELIEARGTW